LIERPKDAHQMPEAKNRIKKRMESVSAIRTSLEKLYAEHQFAFIKKVAKWNPKSQPVYERQTAY